MCSNVIVVGRCTVGVLVFSVIALLADNCVTRSHYNSVREWGCATQTHYNNLMTLAGNILAHGQQLNNQLAAAQALVGAAQAQGFVVPAPAAAPEPDAPQHEIP